MRPTTPSSTLSCTPGLSYLPLYRSRRVHQPRSCAGVSHRHLIINISSEKSFSHVARKEGGKASRARRLAFLSHRVFPSLASSRNLVIRRRESHAALPSSLRLRPAPVSVGKRPPLLGKTMRWARAKATVPAKGNTFRAFRPIEVYTFYVRRLFAVP